MQISHYATHAQYQATKATYGVTGYWHRDGGNTVGTGAIIRPNFAPLGGTASAWCGLRAHGDVSYLDPITGGMWTISKDAVTVDLGSGGA